MAAVASTVAAATSAHAAVFVVTSTIDAVDAAPGNGVCVTAGAVCTLRAAVQEANALTGAHSIVVPAGTFTLTIAGREEEASATGDLNIAVGTSLTIAGANRTTTIIDASAIDRVFRVRGALTLSDVTVRNGLAQGSAPTSAFGGCFYMSSSSLTLARVTVTGCRTGASFGDEVGGGIAVFGSIASPSTLTIADSTIEENATSGNGAGGPGGGIYISSGTTATITRSIVAGNEGEFGGGIHVFGSDGFGASAVTVTRSLIAGNTSTGLGGGGVFVHGSGDGNATVAIVNSTISGNTATVGYGGAVGMGSGAQALTIVNATLAANSSALFGAVRNSASQVQARNTIVANSGGGAPANCSGTTAVVSLGNNLEFPGTTCGFTAAGDVRADPLLGALAGNGGPTLTHALAIGSAGIDAGDNGACAAAPVSGIDQRGIPRPLGAGCDVGAYEAPGSGSGFTDEPLVSGSTAVKAIHVAELRARIDALRSRFGLGAFGWTGDSLAGTLVQAVHLQELRTAVIDAYGAAITAGLPVTQPAFTDSPLVPQATPIRTIHLEQLRVAVLLLEGA